jgi:hypothetical protein
MRITLEEALRDPHHARLPPEQYAALQGAAFAVSVPDRDAILLIGYIVRLPPAAAVVALTVLTARFGTYVTRVPLTQTWMKRNAHLLREASAVVPWHGEVRHG